MNFSNNRIFWLTFQRNEYGSLSWRISTDRVISIHRRSIRCRHSRVSVARRIHVVPCITFIYSRRIMHATISIRWNSILVRGRRARRVEFPYRLLQTVWKCETEKQPENHLEPTWCLSLFSCVVVRARPSLLETQTSGTTALFDEGVLVRWKFDGAETILLERGTKSSRFAIHHAYVVC